MQALEIRVKWNGDREELYLSITWPYELNGYSGLWQYTLQRVVE